MTLIITALCDEFVVQVSDRRFVSTGGNVELAISDEGNKQVVVRGPDYRFVAGFTGLATVESPPDANGTTLRSTGWWLASVIGSADAMAGDMETCVDAVREAADDSFRKLHAKSNRRWPLTVVFAGYQHGARVPTVAVVTNCGAPGYRAADVSDRFTAELRSASGRECVPAGLTAALPRDTTQRIRTVLKRRDYPATADVAVQVVREAAAHAKFRRYVGPNCTSAFIPRDGDVECVYYPVHRRPETFGPNFVDYAGGAVIVSGSVWARVVGTPPPGTRLPELHVGPSGTPIRDRRTLKRLPREVK